MVAAHGSEEEVSKTQAAPTWRMVVWLLAGVTLVVLMILIGLGLRETPDDQPAYVAISRVMPLYLAAGVAYFVALVASPRRIGFPTAMIIMLLVGVSMRVMIFSSPALAGADHCRYRWDGAVTASGGNPYHYSPEELLADPDAADKKLRPLCEKGRPLLGGINHPRYRTMYPPLAQALFAAGHWITPFGIAGWRVVLLICDGMAIVLVMLLLRRAGLPVTHLVVYAWNPLLIIETYFNSHLDLAAVVPVLLAIYLLSRRHVVGAAIALAIATGIKLWPALLLFLILAPGRREPRRLLAGLLAFVGLMAIVAVPYASAFGWGTSGLVAYSHHWYANRGVFVLLQGLGAVVAKASPIELDSRIVARVLVAGVLLVVAVWFGRRATYEVSDLSRRAAMILLIMLLFCPTLYPWYYVALIPLTAMVMRPSLLAWTLLLPLSYVTMHVPHDQALMTRFVIHLPIWLLLLAEMRSLRPGSKALTDPLHV